MENWITAGYLRLSREDGDKAESDSIANQRKLLEQYIAVHPEPRLADFYQDDGYTGTNFDRPAFRRMEEDIKQGRVKMCIRDSNITIRCVGQLIFPPIRGKRHCGPLCCGCRRCHALSAFPARFFALNKIRPNILGFYRRRQAVMLCFL